MGKLDEALDYMKMRQDGFDTTIDKIKGKNHSLNERVTKLETEFNYFRNASNRHEQIVSEMREREEMLRESNNNLALEIVGLKGRLQGIEEYLSDISETEEEELSDQEEQEEEEECEEEICPTCRENEIKDAFDRQQQVLRGYVKSLSSALKHVTNQLDALESA